MLRIVCLICTILALYGCSDFYRKDFVHIASAHNNKDKILLERQIQAMRKSQILQDNHTRIQAIVHYMNAINDASLESDIKHSEVFWVEIFDTKGQIDINQLSLSLSNGIKSIPHASIDEVQKDTLDSLAPDVSYHHLYKVLFASMGEVGKNNLKLRIDVKNIGTMLFDYGYTKRKSALNQ